MAATGVRLGARGGGGRIAGEHGHDGKVREVEMTGAGGQEAVEPSWPPKHEHRRVAVGPLGRLGTSRAWSRPGVQLAFSP